MLFPKQDAQREARSRTKLGRPHTIVPVYQHVIKRKCYGCDWNSEQQVLLIDRDDFYIPNRTQVWSAP